MSIGGVYQWLERFFIWPFSNDVSIAFDGINYVPFCSVEPEILLFDREEEDQFVYRDRYSVVQDGDLGDDVDDLAVNQQGINDAQANIQPQEAALLENVQADEHFNELDAQVIDQNIHPLVQLYRSACEQEIMYQGESGRYSVEFFNFGVDAGIDTRVQFMLINPDEGLGQRDVMLNAHERNWQLSISINDALDDQNFVDAVSLILPILQEYQVDDFVVRHSGQLDRVRFEPAAGGRHISISALRNEHVNWEGLIQRVTDVLHENGIQPGPLPFFENRFGHFNGEREDEVRGTPYFSVRARQEVNQEQAGQEGDDQAVNPLANLRIHNDGQLLARAEFPDDVLARVIPRENVEEIPENNPGMGIH